MDPVRRRRAVLRLDATRLLALQYEIPARDAPRFTEIVQQRTLTALATILPALLKLPRDELVALPGVVYREATFVLNCYFVRPPHRVYVVPLGDAADASGRRRTTLPLALHVVVHLADEPAPTRPAPVPAEATVADDDLADFASPKRVRRAGPPSAPAAPASAAFDASEADQNSSPGCPPELEGIMPELRGILRGRVASWRRDAFSGGAKPRDALKVAFNFVGVPEDEVAAVSEHLLRMFCRNHSNRTAFVLDVLVPEAVIRIAVVRRGLTYEQVDSEMLDGVPASLAAKQLVLSSPYRPQLARR